MPRKRFKVELLLSAVAVLVGSGGGGVFVRPALEPDRIIASRFGDVAWNHELHARLPDIANCTVCHHQEKQGDMEPEPCGHCHDSGSNAEALVLPGLFLEGWQPPRYEGENGPPARVALHGRCIGCHEAKEEGPVGCRDCHAQRFTGDHGVARWDHFLHARKIAMDEETGLDGNCVYCHHQDEDATWDADYRSCSLCHEPASAQGMDWSTDTEDHEDYLHLECVECHEDFNPEDDLRSCADCHPGVAVHNEGIEDEDSKARPPIESAIHDRCLACHKPDYEDLRPGMPRTCPDCHEPDQSSIEVPGVGTILWPHDRHARFGEEIRCDTCHHTDSKGEHHAACRSCHDTGVIDNPPLAEAFEDLCLGCHEERGNGLDRWDALRAGPPDGDQGFMHDADEIHYAGPDGEFVWNLRRHAVDYGLSCRDCHHATLRDEDGWVWADRLGRPWPDEAARLASCRDCHGDTGPVPASLASGTDAPDIHGVYRKLCVDCHAELDVTPGTWEALFAKEKVKKEVSQ